MAEWLKIDKETASATYDSSVRTFSEDLNLPDGGLRLLIDEAKRAVKVTREVSLNDVADLSILRAAQKEMGIKKFPIWDFRLKPKSQILTHTGSFSWPYEAEVPYEEISRRFARSFSLSHLGPSRRIMTAR
jgi:hypothetical protein